MTFAEREKVKAKLNCWSRLKWKYLTRARVRVRRLARKIKSRVRYSIFTPTHKFVFASCVRIKLHEEEVEFYSVKPSSVGVDT